MIGSVVWRQKVKEGLLGLIFPKRAICMGCGSAAGFERDWLCEDCRKKLARQWIGAFPEAQLNGAAAAYHYGGPAGGVVRNLKYRGILKLAEPMVKDMLRACDQIQPIGAELVVPVPMHAKRLRRRGFNQSEVLARALAEGLNLPFENGLVRTRNTVQQAKLKGEARRKNLKDAFRAESSVSGRRVLLVDDVYTTGETARQCAKALRDAGAVSVSFIAYTKGGD